MRIIPYPPSFSNTAARIIEPAIGASTCAFGNHKCNPYSGILIIKAISSANHHVMWVHEFSIVGWFSCIVCIDREPFSVFRDRRAISSGRDPIRV